jgi:hypothetical protein
MSECPLFGAIRRERPDPTFVALVRKFTLLRARNFAHGVDELAFLDRELRLELLLQVVVAILAQPRHLGAQNETLDPNLAH